MRAYVVVVVAARANSVVPRRRMVCVAEVVVPQIFFRASFVRDSVVDFQSRSRYLIGVAIWLWLLQRTIVIVPEVRCSETAETPLC